MFALKLYEGSSKNQVFIAVFISSKLSTLNKKEGISEFSASPKTSNNLARISNPDPCLIASQTPKYSENNLQQIFNVVLKATQLLAYDQDSRKSKKLPERIFKPRAPNIYKSKLPFNCYNYIQ